MIIQSLKTYHIRNLVDGELLFSPGANFIFGQNGQGKTNIVEAINVLSAGKSFRTSELKELIRWEEESASLFCSIKNTLGTEELGLIVGARERSATVNGNVVKSLSDFVGRLLCVTFNPNDLEIVQSGPQGRRKFMDRHMVDLQPGLIRDLIEYQRALKSKNALLRNDGVRAEDLEPWNHIIAQKAAVIMPARRDIVVAIGEMANDIYQTISSSDGKLTLRYSPSCKSKEWNCDSLRAELATHAEREIARRGVVIGPQRDDFIIELGGHPAGVFASQGQTRSIVLSLKLAVIELLEARRGESPVVLLDDVDSELDQRRSDALFERMYRAGRQVFVTGTDRDSVTRLRATDGVFEFTIEGGRAVVGS